MSYQPPTDQNAILMMRFSAIAYDTPGDIPNDLTNQSVVPPQNGSWQCVWGPHYDGFRIAINELAFVAYEAASNQYAVVIRGTTPDSLIDWHFDLDTWPLQPLRPYLPDASSDVETATGTLHVFEKVIALGGTGGALLDYFKGLATPPATVFVTGHSLGGTMAALVAAWLKCQFSGISGFTDVVVQPYTFAAFTPGNKPLADYLDKTFGSGAGLAPAWRYYNQLDVAPVLWTSLNLVKNLYPSYGFHGLGPDEIAHSFGKIPSGEVQVYFQPAEGGFQLQGQMQTEGWGLESQWDREAGFQHSHLASYLPLMLGQPQTLAAATAPSHG